MQKYLLLIILVIPQTTGLVTHVVASDDLGRQLVLIDSLIENYCIDCHSGSGPPADLSFDEFDTSVVYADRPWDTSQWEKMVRRLRARQMPPIDAMRPEEGEYEAAITALETALDQVANKFPQPGRTVSIRRLNRSEYQNAIRDLLALDVNVGDLLPADQAGHGFDNVTVSELSPALLDRYITAAEQISRLAIGGKQRSPGGVTFRVPPDRTQERHIEGLPLGTRGGALFEHHFAQGGKYEIQLRLTRDRDEHVEGIFEPHDIDILLDRELMHRFTVSPPIGQGDVIEEYQQGHELIDAHLKARINIAAGPRTIGVTFPQKFASLVETKRQPFDANFNRHRHPRRTPALYEVSIAGPFDSSEPGKTPSRMRIFTCTPDGKNDAATCAKVILRRLLRLAYRRPIDDADLAIPMHFFNEELSKDGFEAGIESALSSILVSPHFLFRLEKDPQEAAPEEIYRISDIELASRLSFFLWSSIPDQQLLDLAEAGRLHQTNTLKAQVRRMLQDDRSQSLTSNFAAQWLYLRNLDSIRPDMRLFPGFDDNLRQALRRETELLFTRIVRKDRSVLELIDSKITFLNERLAKHYGIPHVSGSQFRQVTVPSGSHRGGILRQGSILAVTSYATRTSPSIRGNWILDNVLGVPPPPPPPNVPSLNEKASSSNMTIRERLTEHRANPSCASCHNLMDPIGFSLENYDAVGRWRIFEKGQPIDASGTMLDGTVVNSIEELEAQILKSPEMFVGTMVEKLLTFALGRGIESYDAPAIRQIVRNAATHDYRFSSLIEEIVLSTPFQMRMTE